MEVKQNFVPKRKDCVINLNELEKQFFAEHLWQINLLNITSEKYRTLQKGIKFLCFGKERVSWFVFAPFVLSFNILPPNLMWEFSAFSEFLIFL